MNTPKKDDNTHKLPEIKDYLTQIQWPMEEVENGIRTLYKGDFGSSPVLIYLEGKHIIMIIEPIIKKDKHRYWGRAVINLMNSMKKEIKHVDIGINSGGEIFAQVKIPEQHVNLERFQCLLFGVCQVAENVTLPILQANVFDRISTETKKKS